ncbi:MarR family winged helix-turn-helix transcriptional regulator [Kitasatospora sp. NPDC059571]|uniref:MarR family winged helix-turn-helix transcriptional regulator n=1 Tax=Kitasatospora sp. NPDC059571 TaxID=3346871 RepID=UPI00368141C7
MTTPPTADTAAELADALTRAMKRIRRQTMRRLEPLGITPAQARALRTLAHLGGRPGTGDHPHHHDEPPGHDRRGGRGCDDASMRLSELADRLHIAPRSATTVVDALEEAGLVARTPDPVDRRAVRVVLTEAGHAALERIGQVRHEIAQAYFGPLSSSDQAALLQALRTAEEAYEDAAAAPPSAAPPAAAP